MASTAREVAGKAASLLKFGAAVYFFRDWLCEPTVCVGPSMLPTLAARGDIVLAESFSVRTGQLRVGDVVVARSPTNARHTICKRILGLEGDLVEVGEPSPSSSSSGGSGGARSPTGVVVPKGYAWLQGDNLRNSTDSRSYGPVPAALVRARVYFRAWPPSRVGKVAGGEEALEEKRRGRRWYEQEYNKNIEEKRRKGR